MQLILQYTTVIVNFFSLIIPDNTNSRQFPRNSLIQELLVKSSVLMCIPLAKKGLRAVSGWEENLVEGEVK